VLDGFDSPVRDELNPAPHLQVHLLKLIFLRFGFGWRIAAHSCAFINCMEGFLDDINYIPANSL
jgi:hypothetical protein